MPSLAELPNETVAEFTEVADSNYRSTITISDHQSNPIQSGEPLITGIVLFQSDAIITKITRLL